VCWNHNNLILRITEAQLTTGVTNFSTENNGAESPATSGRDKAELDVVLLSLGVAKAVKDLALVKLSFRDELLVNDVPDLV
jgi:hypothetical protein